MKQAENIFILEAMHTPHQKKKCKSSNSWIEISSSQESLELQKSYKAQLCIKMSLWQICSGPIMTELRRHGNKKWQGALAVFRLPLRQHERTEHPLREEDVHTQLSAQGIQHGEYQYPVSITFVSTFTCCLGPWLCGLFFYDWENILSTLQWKISEAKKQSRKSKQNKSILIRWGSEHGWDQSAEVRAERTVWGFCYSCNTWERRGWWGVSIQQPNPTSESTCSHGLNCDLRSCHTGS